MRAIKGCVNARCSAHKKKRYKESDAYCSICGSPLFYVCKDCFTQLPNGEKRYCIRCEAIHDDNAETAKKRLALIVTSAVAVVATGAKYGKKAIEIVNDLISK